VLYSFPRALRSPVQSLLGYIPTAEELEQISSYPDDRSKLGKAEQFFWEIRVTLRSPSSATNTLQRTPRALILTRALSVRTHRQTIPRLEARLKAFLFKLKYTELRDSVRPVRPARVTMHACSPYLSASLWNRTWTRCWRRATK
jgi:hypothetical protein